MMEAAMRPLTVLILSTSLLACAHPGSQTPAPAPSPSATEEVRTEQAPAVTGARFDKLVRGDFFRGFGGDAAALDRAMSLCDATLARDGNHAEALVWHGGGLVFRSAALFGSGDIEGGLSLWNRGLAEVNRAVTLAPSNIGLRIARGAMLLTVYRYDPDPVSREALLRAGIDDYQVVLQTHDALGDQLSPHARGELLAGLGEGLTTLGDSAHATQYFERTLSELPETSYAENAKRWLEPATNLGARKSGMCNGCHGES
jgi:hypothetical protein